MEELMRSMVRFSAALTAFGLQQLQNAFSNPRQSLKSVDQLQEAMDSVTQSLTSRIDESEKTAMNSMVSIGSDLVAKTVGAVETSAEMVKKGADTLTGRRGKKHSAAAKHKTASSHSGKK
jgi:hypothetical protein